ncbi:MAG: SH3 domain-containing protein [Chloroflexota bacterium]|nr:SH3 domain-containing protein [Chloroflexota bacterium]
MIQTTAPAIAAPVAPSTEATAGPLTLRVEEAVAAEGNVIVANTNAQNDAPPDGLAYVLARVTVTNTGQQTCTVAASDFAATGTDGVLRRCPSIALPDPPLNATIAPGESVYGWTGGLVNDVSNVVLLFDPAISVGERFSATFALTDGAAIPTFDTASAETDAGTSLDAPAGFGETVRTGMWEVTISDAIGTDTYFEISDYRVRALGAPTDDPDGWRSLGLEVTIRNITEAPQFFSWTSLELIDTNGEPWDHLLATTQPYPTASVELLPGASVTGWYGIWLQPWATTSLLRLRDSVLTDDFRYISLNGTTGSASSASEESDEMEAAVSEPLNLAPGDLAEVGADPLNLRDEASTTGEIVTELDPGTEVAITGDVIEAESYRWYPVEVVATGETGFVAEDFITPTGE